MGDIDQLARLDRAQRERIVDEAIRSVLSLMERAMPDAPGPAITSGEEAAARLLELPVISAADVISAGDPRCADGVTLTWPVGPGRLLAIRLLPSLEGTALPDALACLAGVVRMGATAGLGAGAGAVADAGAGPGGGPGDGSGDGEALSPFLSRAAVGEVMHKMSTPLTSVMAYASLLADPNSGPLNADQQQFVETLERNAQRLMEMINEFNAGLQREPTSTGQEDQ